MEGVPDTTVAMVEINGRREGGLIDMGRDMGVVLTLPRSPHNMSVSYLSALANVTPPA
jgi:hypothetical protein